MRAIELSEALLNTGGNFVGKIFVGEDFETARTHMRTIFKTVKIVKPKSVRSESFETYLVGLSKK
jgi:23S rRNA (uridine2552-2'-O)-methyltransferase